MVAKKIKDIDLGKDIVIEIPPELMKEFRGELRVVVKHPWTIGIPVPERLLTSDALKALTKNFDVILTPKQQVKK